VLWVSRRIPVRHGGAGAGRPAISGAWLEVGMAIGLPGVYAPRQAASGPIDAVSETMTR